MKAIKINSELKKIYIVYINHYNEIYPHLNPQCTTFCCPVTFENQDTIFSDDEGLYNQFEGGFIFNDWNYPLVGNAIILGTDNEGDSVDVKTSIQEIEKKITWVSKEDCIKWANHALNTPPKIYGL